MNNKLLLLMLFLYLQVYSYIFSSCNLPTRHGIFQLDIHKINNLDIPVIYKKIEDIKNYIPLVRIHDACMTSEIFDSLRCDCDEQLKLSMKLIHRTGGLLLYLPNEGRGIGIANKINAYNVQDNLKLDTYNANLYLNLPEDSRDYSYVPNILKEYKFEKINLLSNSKIKYSRLNKLNININKVIPLIIPSNNINFKYLEAKRKMNINNDYDKKINYCTIEEAIKELQSNKPIILVDDEDRENEGDLIFPAEIVTSNIMAFIIKYTSGLVCCAMSYDMVNNLNLPLMIPEYQNNDPHKTAFTISVDYKIGTTTGISAEDRALTCKKLTEETNLNNFNMPGHIFPLKAHKDGLLKRQGHTEASIEICKLAGFKPCAVISEITTEDKLKMATGIELNKLAIKYDLKILKIEQLKN